MTSSTSPFERGSLSVPATVPESKDRPRSIDEISAADTAELPRPRDPAGQVADTGERPRLP